MSWTPRQVPPDSFNTDDTRWKATAFGSKGHFKIKLEDDYQANGGAATYSYLNVPYPHRIVSIEIKHTDAAKAESVVVLTTGYFDREKWTNLWEHLWDYAAVGAVSDFLSICGDGWEYPPCRYRFNTNTTEGHLMYYEVILQILEPTGEGRMKGKEYVSRR